MKINQIFTPKFMGWVKAVFRGRFAPLNANSKVSWKLDTEEHDKLNTSNRKGTDGKQKKNNVKLHCWKIKDCLAKLSKKKKINYWYEKLKGKYHLDTTWKEKGRFWVTLYTRILPQDEMNQCLKNHKCQNSSMMK